MTLHVNIRELVTPDGFSLVTCHCTLRFFTRQKIEIKPDLLTVLKIRDSKKALPRSCPVFFKLVLNLVQVRATRPTFNT